MAIFEFDVCCCNQFSQGTKKAVPPKKITATTAAPGNSKSKAKAKADNSDAAEDQTKKRAPCKSKVAKSVETIATDGEEDPESVYWDEDHKEHAENELERHNAALNPRDTSTLAKDYATPSLLGYAKLSIGLARPSLKHPELKLGPLQRDPNHGQVNRLAVIGWDQLYNESITYAIGVSINPDIINCNTLTLLANGPFQHIGFKEGAEKDMVLLQAGQHQIFLDTILLYEQLTELKLSGLEPNQKKELADAENKLLTEVVWLAAVYDRALEKNKEEYYSFLLQVSMNSELGSATTMRTTLTACCALLLTIRLWAASQQDTDVRRLVNRYPDVIDLFADIHKMREFCAESVSPKALLEIKRVGWGIYEPCIRGIHLLVHWLGSLHKIPLKEGEVPSQVVNKIQKRLRAFFLREPNFAFSQRIVDILVDGFDSSFDTYLEAHMAYFAAGNCKVEGSSVIWKIAFAAYSELILKAVNHWPLQEQAANSTGALLPEDQAIMALVKGKLDLIFQFQEAVSGFPMVPRVLTGTFPLMCPKFLLALHGELMMINPLLRLIAHWFVPGILDVVKQRMATDSLCTDPIQSETELMRDILAYFHYRNNLADSNGTVLHKLWYKLISRMLELCGCNVASLIPSLSMSVWPKVTNLPDIIGDEHPWAEDVQLNITKEEMSMYTGLMLSWAKCPPNIAAQFPDCILQVLERTMINWMVASSGTRNSDAGRKRFLANTFFETYTVAAVWL
ncbi:hypothetical protein B0H14DRAFT_3438735 [Mycena olivaceomarginata]|nr:hypothetical protein B0H14DRAFT_3438735 [Mycena olivaceomarginata]